MLVILLCIVSRWYCHFDDDEYVNIGVLAKLLSKYNPESEKVYLGNTNPRQIKPDKVGSCFYLGLFQYLCRFWVL